MPSRPQTVDPIDVFTRNSCGDRRSTPWKNCQKSAIPMSKSGSSSIGTNIPWGNSPRRTEGTIQFVRCAARASYPPSSRPMQMEYCGALSFSGCREWKEFTCSSSSFSFGGLKCWMSDFLTSVTWAPGSKKMSASLRLLGADSAKTGARTAMSMTRFGSEGVTIAIMVGAVAFVGGSVVIAFAPEFEDGRNGVRFYRCSSLRSGASLDLTSFLLSTYGQSEM